MPRKYSRRNMKGGFDFNSLTSSLTSGWNSLSQNSKSWWEKLKSPTTSSTGSSYGSTGSSYGSTGSTSYSTPSSSYSTPGTPSYGGRKRRHRSRKMRGGNFTDNTPTTGLAFHAAPFSGETARPNTIVGGKTRKRRKHVKSHRKY